MKTEIELNPFLVPQFLCQQMPPGRRQDGFLELPRIYLKDIPEETLDALCRDFRARVFKEAGKRDPLGEPCKCRCGRQPEANVMLQGVYVASFGCKCGTPAINFLAQAHSRLKALELWDCLINEKPFPGYVRHADWPGQLPPEAYGFVDELLPRGEPPMHCGPC